MESKELLDILNKHYSYRFMSLELLREGGNATYAAYTEHEKFFVKVIGDAFSDTFIQSVGINLFLQDEGFSVPHIIMTGDKQAFVVSGANRIMLYDFLNLTEIDMATDAEEVGALIGQLHSLMSKYKGDLPVHDKDFYLNRYLRILSAKKYPRVHEFEQYGEQLWERVNHLPRGYSHGDMYCGNIARDTDGQLYILDFDTSCIGFPLYDLALICNRTDYFCYQQDSYEKTADIIKRLLPEYCKFNSEGVKSTSAIYDLLALYHFALQATIIEIYGIDCVDPTFFDAQLDWLQRWKKQCGLNGA